MCRRHSGYCERGVTAVLVAVVLAVLCAFLVLALNVGHGYSVRAELQNAGDSSALAGVADIGGSGITALRTSLTTARNTALSYAGYHATDSTISVASPDVCLGIWHSEYATPSFECISSSTAGDAAAPDSQVYLVNAVQVGAARNASQEGGALTVYGGGIVGQSTANVVTHATAARFGPCKDDCAAPLVFAACQINTGMLPCGTTETVMSSAIQDNIGFTIYQEHQQATPPSIQSLLMTMDPGPGGGWICKPPGSCVGISADTHGQPGIKIDNGNNLGGANTNSIYNSLSCLVGRTIDVGIVDVPCSGYNPTFSGASDKNPLVGFARVTIISIDPIAKSITLYRDCGAVESDTGHCRAFGVLNTRPVLVQ